MDYRLSDPYLDPPGIEEPVYTEQTIRLPQTYWCYQPIGTPPVGPLPSLQEGRVTFGCLNNFCKVNPLTLGTWARILQAVPDSQLLLHAAEGSHRWRTAELLQQLGVDPRRLSLSRPCRLKYLGYQRWIWPWIHSCIGGTTSCDAFWMACQITLRGVTAVVGPG
jgi:predicted O-linked N-acetylglucosamine transferase (SPINDLY family)